MDSNTPADAAVRLTSLGVLGPLERSLASTDEDSFRFLLVRLWNAAASGIPSEFPVDKSFPVPALKVVRDGVIFYVHGVSHGQLSPPRRASVLRLASRLTASGTPLYSEQNLPAYYGYKAGKETLDHRAPDGYPVTLVPAAPGFSRTSLAVKRLIDFAVAPGSALASLAWAALSPYALLPWLASALTLALAWYILSAGLPLQRLRRRRRAADARRDGLDDMAAQFADEARDFFVAAPDLEKLRGLELPQPLGAQAFDPFSIRSRAIADAVAADAAASGAKAAHVVVGHLHAHEVAWRLAHGPRNAVPGSQNS